MTSDLPWVRRGRLSLSRHSNYLINWSRALRVPLAVTTG